MKIVLEASGVDAAEIAKSIVFQYQPGLLADLNALIGAKLHRKGIGGRSRIIHSISIHRDDSFKGGSNVLKCSSLDDLLEAYSSIELNNAT